MAARGVRVRALEKKPELFDYLMFYWEAYEKLLRSRSQQQGSILFSEMLAYCELYGIEDREDFVETVQLIERSLNENSELADGRLASNSKGGS